MNKKAKILLFLIPFPLYDVSASQNNFKNLIRFLKSYFKENNYRVIICSFNNKKKSSNSDSLINGNKLFEGIEFHFFYRFFPSVKPLFQIIEMVLNILRFLIICLKYNPDIVYGYSEKPVFFASFWKNFFKYKLIYDIRGDIVDEYKSKKYPSWKIYFTKKLVNISKEKSDLIFTVSTAYKDELNKKKIVHKYNFYNGECFYYEKKEAINQKEKLGLKDKFVFLYNGSDHYYQNLEKMVYFFCEFHKQFNDSFFIILSNSPEKSFIKFFKKYNVVENSFFIINLKQEELNKYQITADLGFLLRNDLPLNHNSFPTKFGEYLASGVPVLTTRHIHSIASWIEKFELGEIIDLNKNPRKYFNLIYNKYKDNFVIKKKCATFAELELKWQNKSLEIFNIIDRL